MERGGGGGERGDVRARRVWADGTRFAGPRDEAFADLSQAQAGGVQLRRLVVQTSGEHGGQAAVGDGVLGGRLHPPGWTEISAVCTDPARRGRELATRLVLAVAAGIRSRGETPFLHASAANVGAIPLYERLGFRLRRTTDFRTVRVPARDPSTGTPVTAREAAWRG